MEIDWGSIIGRDSGHELPIQPAMLYPSSRDNGHEDFTFLLETSIMHHSRDNGYLQ